MVGLSSPTICGENMELDTIYLFDVMEKKNLSITDISKKTGIAAREVYELLYEKQTLCGRSLSRLCTFFNVSPHILIKNTQLTIPQFV